MKTLVCDPFFISHFNFSLKETHKTLVSSPFWFITKKPFLYQESLDLCHGIMKKTWKSIRKFIITSFTNQVNSFYKLCIVVGSWVGFKGLGACSRFLHVIGFFLISFQEGMHMWFHKHVGLYVKLKIVSGRWSSGCFGSN